MLGPTSRRVAVLPRLGIVVNRSINTCSTAYPSGSVRNPTQIIIKPAPYLTDQPVNRSEKSRTLPYSHRELPHLPSRTPLYVGSFVVIATIWSGFIYFSTNAEKSNSSIVKAVLFELRSNPTILASLGASIKPEKDDFFGQLWVDGQINLMQGSVDVAFRVTGSERSGKVYFTSVRRDRGSEFEIIRWKLIRDDGVVVDLVNQDNRPVLVTSTDNEGVAITSLLPTSSLHSTYTETPVVRLV
ncbi:hypothetical protein MJO29_014983 [Puccinia striiformis f. sp. tritici]|uniref:Uncharacterized protein n=1 Tax=Puccinia striiformis f. sp. tritici PST-78 TaxID=1165861 RepID=A0A0L0VW86_9BASI|nr:hypothetical protein Pst134EA_028050 [Puccinia striiformis f. sp. tritici]KAH9448755.1 hypothetical protein Pst134EA_028050 [Puccinia striiformis f. sp. tritici]KAI7937668.1 hypothetical protein MJO29_014983 [Puccinia striiformis f. sp. tritici]KNF03275.1 hypothetical protein PSTG_03540 [Puccinia striiformis f. sp. tritici PST-78]